MKKSLALKKVKISIFLLLLFNQFLFSSYALNSKKVYKIDSLEHKKKNKKEFHRLFSEIREYDEQSITKEAEDIEKYIEEVFGPNSLDKFQDQIKKSPLKNNNLDKSNKDYFKKDDNNKNLPKLKNYSSDKSKNKKETLKINDSKENNLEKLLLPSQSVISTNEFKISSRGYVNLKGPKITLNLQEANSIESLKLIAKLGDYGVVIIEDNNLKNEENINNSKITANFNNTDISYVFNSILFSANLQAIVEGNIIFIGKNILNKSIKPKVSKTFRLNQVNAASVADYLSTLGAQVSKVMLISGTLKGTEIQDGFVNKKEFKDELKNSYGIEGGPLFGLIGTADLRLQTITLIGSKNLIKTAEKYIKSLDVRHRQLALTVKIIDVGLTKADIKDNILEMRTGDTRIINNGGLGLITGNKEPINAPAGISNVPNIITLGISEGNFVNWLEAKITNQNAKILASPTLILGENPNNLFSGAAQVDDALGKATIGRPFKNEAFIKVGETVITSFSKTINDGAVTCKPMEGTAGITFGAKVDKIDDNGYVTFALSPAISAVTSTVEVPGCGIQSTLSVRKLDTGSIRVKNGETLILTGVLKDEDNITTSKVPIFGDIPVLGSLFRKNTNLKRKSELIILVTPKILKD